VLMMPLVLARPPSPVPQSEGETADPLREWMAKLRLKIDTPTMSLASPFFPTVSSSSSSSFLRPLTPEPVMSLGSLECWGLTLGRMDASAQPMHASSSSTSFGKALHQNPLSGIRMVFSDMAAVCSAQWWQSAGQHHANVKERGSEAKEGEWKPLSRSAQGNVTVAVFASNVSLAFDFKRSGLPAMATAAKMTQLDTDFHVRVMNATGEPEWVQWLLQHARPEAEAVLAHALEAAAALVSDVVVEEGLTSALTKADHALRPLLRPRPAPLPPTPPRSGACASSPFFHRPTLFLSFSPSLSHTSTSPRLPHTFSSRRLRPTTEQVFQRCVFPRE
jgi:hypothetical protein